MQKFIQSAISLNLEPYLPKFLIENPIYRNDNARVGLFTIGASLVLFKSLSYINSVFGPLFQFEKDLSRRYGPNSWALITGSSDGIGKIFAFELAKRGFNIILVGRNKEKLKNVDNELRIAHPSVQTRILVAEFSQSYEPRFTEKIYEQVNDLDVSLLINNAGVHVKGHFEDASTKELTNAVLVDALAHAVIMRVFLPAMKTRPNRSGIINVSSLAASCPKPFEVLYSSAKVFHSFLSRALVYEHPNIDILSMTPGKIKTKMIGNQEIDLKTVSPEDFVKVSLRSLGNTNTTCGHWKHRLDKFEMDHIPGFYFRTYMGRRFGLF